MPAPPQTKRPAAPPYYIVELITLSSGWINFANEDEAEVVFASHAEAEAALEEHLAEMEEAVRDGDLTDTPPREDYRITLVAN